jgi:Fe-S oxidoreductase
VLESAGFNVVVPQQALCCGRPLYDFGFLRQAKALLQEIMSALRPQIRAGIPIVGLEPSCVSVFRDELHSFYPHDEDAKRLMNQVFTLPEFLERYAEDFEIPQLEREALVHIHCHHHAIIGRDSERWLLDQMGLDYEFTDSGCCGMAGSFGYEAEKYDVSIACAERALIPAIEEAGHETLIITNGFSCRGQINHLCERRPLHIAQVVQMALRQGPEGPTSFRPEDVYYLQFAPSKEGTAVQKAALGLGGALASGLVAWGIKHLIDHSRNGDVDKEIVKESTCEPVEQGRYRNGI